MAAENILLRRFEGEKTNMKFYREICLGDGRVCILRSAEEQDAPELLAYLKEVARETPYLVSEPEEITLTMEQEKDFIRHQAEDERAALLMAEIDGTHIGNCSMNPVGSNIRYRHRCSVAIALYRQYCGRGIGKMILRELLALASSCGYEQAELEVVTANERAVHLYESLGFETYGMQKHSMKYKDGSYADEYLMMKKLSVDEDPDKR